MLDLVQFEITEEPIDDPRQKKIPQPVQNLIDEMYVKVQNPAEAADAVPVLLELIERYPDVPRLYNHLCIAYQSSGQHEKVPELINRTYRLFPDYLFGMANYAWQLLQKGRVEEVTALLNRRFGLHLWIRDRRRYHQSEFLSFNSLMVGYFTALGKEDVARTYLDMMRSVAPDHPATRQAADCLRSSFLRSSLRLLNSKRPSIKDLLDALQHLRR